MKGTRLTTFKNLLRFVILGDFSANKLKYILTIMGIALGIGIFVAVETAHDTIKQSFQQTRGYVPGRPDLQVSAGEFGFDEEIIRRIEAHPMVARTHPLLIVPATLKVGDREIPFQIYGADLLEANDSKGSYALVLEEGAHYSDLLTDPESLILNEAFALENGWTLGMKIRVQSQDRIADFVLRGLMRSPPHVTGGNRYGVVDIAWAQLLFGRLGRLDRLDVTLRRDVDRLEAERELNRVLPPHITAFSPETSGMNMTGLVSSFQLNITALSLISLLVGMFLIYNTIFISYIRKRRQIGILRALGVTRKGIFWIFTTESLFYGTVGGFLGVWLGYALSYFTVDSMATTVNMLYTQVDASQVRLSPRIMIMGMVMGIVAAFLSSLVPAMEAARTSQAETLKMGSYEIRFGKTHRKLFVPGLLLLVISVVLAFQKPVWGIPLFGYTATMTIMFGMALITPFLAAPLSKLIHGILSRFLGAEGFLAQKNLLRNLGRSSVILCAIMVSLGMTVSFIFMIHSFRTSLADLIDQVVRFQFYVADRHRIERGTPVLLPKRLAGEIAAIEGVSAVEGYSLVNQPFEDRSIVLMSADLNTYRKYDQIRFVEGDAAGIYENAVRGGILISEALATRHGLRAGDTMELNTPSGPAKFHVEGVFYNYQFDRGMAYLHRSLYERYYPPDELTGIYVYVDDPGAAAQVRERLENDLADRYGLVIVLQQKLKQYIMDAFDQTFAITYALQLIAIVVAVLAIVNTFSAAILERQREIGIMRCMGFFRSQIRKMVLIEAGVIGGIGCLFGLLNGLMLALVLIYVINKQSFGWSIQFHAPLGSLAWATLLVFATTLLAGVFPAGRAARTNLTEAFRYE